MLRQRGGRGCMTNMVNWIPLAQLRIYLGQYVLANIAASLVLPVLINRSTHRSVSPTDHQMAQARLFCPAVSARAARVNSSAMND